MITRFAKIFVVLFGVVAVGILLIACGVYKIVHPSSSKQSGFSSYYTDKTFIEDIDNTDLSGEDIALSFNVKSFAWYKKDLHFSLNLLQKSLKDINNNLIISPISLYITAVLLANGAEDKSLAELKKMLLLPDNAEMSEVNEYTAAYLRGVSPKIEINSSIWVDKLTSEYKKAVKPLTEIKSRPQYTDKINAWIADKTAGRITNLVANKKTINGEIFMVNTVYFNDEWEKTFNKTNTSIQPFYSLDSSEPDEVYMMRKTDTGILYYEDDKMQSIKLLYCNGDYLRIFLPRKEIDFATFLQNLKVSDLDVKYAPQYVSVNVPRFEIDHTFNTAEMTELFNKLGVINLFKRCNTDFEKLGRGEKILAELLHRANIKVDEKGTEASAASFIVVDMVGKDIDEPIIFKADHPFVFMINDGLFVGAYVKGDMQ